MIVVTYCGTCGHPSTEHRHGRCTLTLHIANQPWRCPCRDFTPIETP